MKIILLLGVLPVLSLAAGMGAIWPDRAPVPPPFTPPETVAVPAGEIAWRPLGNFAQDGKARTPRTQPRQVPAFEIMKYEVTGTQYAACVAEGACVAVPGGSGSLPQTQVNWQEATAFARWYSDRTGESWRLPSEPEWQRAAADRFGDAAADPDALDPGERMLANYDNGLLLRNGADPVLRPGGGFGENALGIADMSGNVWEWTDSCMENGALGADGRITRSEAYCGVRVAGGLHRAAVIDFVRDASVGGCAAGLPPDHLGFRLVRDG